MAKTRSMKCIVCEKRFPSKRSHAKTCSPACRNALAGQKHFKGSSLSEKCCHRCTKATVKGALKLGKKGTKETMIFWYCKHCAHKYETIERLPGDKFPDHV